MKLLLTLLLLILPSLAAAQANMTYSAVPVPCRVFDSRHLATPAPLAANSTTGIGVKGAAWSAQGGDSGCALPPDAKAALLAITWIAPDRSGHITLFQSGAFAIMPHATMAYALAGVTGTGSATVELCNDLDCAGIDFYLYTFPQAHYTVDLVGYYH